METKDLVLLMLIPLLLVSLIIYTDVNPVITGAAIFQKKQSSILGQYSILPSFKANIDHDLVGDYKNKIAAFDNLLGECKNRKDAMEQCLKDKSDKIGWNCISKNDASVVLYDFVDKFNECLNLKEEGVVCRFSFDERGITNRKFNIKLTSKDLKIRAEIIEDDKVIDHTSINQEDILYADYDTKDTEGKSSEVIDIAVEYKSGKPIIDKAIAVPVTDKPNINLNKMFLLYKAKDGVKFIDADQDAGFREDTPINKIIDLPKTRGIKFCAKSDKQIYAYDASDSQVKLRDIVYKFAVTFPRPVPKPIENLEVHDALNAEHSAILVWDKSNEVGIKSYSIYYSQKDFIKDKMENLKKNNEIKKISVPIENPIEIEDIDLNNCGFDPVGKPCKYKLYNKVLEKGKLYYLKPKDKEKGKFVYLINDVEDGTEHNFAVTAVNQDNEELDNDLSIEGNTYILKLNQNYRKFKPIDDLSPSKVENLKQKTEDSKIKLAWDKPLKNLDGSTSFDIKGFNIYYKKPSIELPPKLDILSPFPTPPTKKSITTAEAKCESLVAVACEYNIENLALEKDQIYIVGVIAVDENSNEFTNDLEVIPVKVS